MRSLMVKQLWLIQPQDPATEVLPLDAAGGGTIHFSPAWDLVCLHAFILERTGHRSSIIDLRLHDRIEDGFRDWMPGDSGRDHVVALIYATTHNLESTGEIIRYLKGALPNSRVVLFGPYPSAYPETLHLLPGIDFALCGDPEIKLRLLLDSLDVSHRLRNIAGLYARGTEIKSANWLPDLKNLSLPDWQQYNWRDYRVSTVQRGARIEARLSRGHPGTGADAPWPGRNEPMREWPMQQLAQRLKRCPGNGIDEIFFADPPGFWTDARLSGWCGVLRNLRNTQEWSFQIIARDLPDVILNELPVNGCHRVEIIIPTTNPAHQPEFGMSMTLAGLKNLITRMRQRSIDGQVVYWIEGPHAEAGEASAIMRYNREIGSPSFAVYPFPCHDDSPLAAKYSDQSRKAPDIHAWIASAQDPAGRAAPCGLWGGSAARSHATGTLRAIHRKIARNPMRLLKRWIPLEGGDLREKISQHAIAAWKKIATRTLSIPGK